MKAKLFQAVLVCLAAFLGAALVQWVSAGKAVGQDGYYDVKADTSYPYELIPCAGNKFAKFNKLTGEIGYTSGNPQPLEDISSYPAYAVSVEPKNGFFYLTNQDTGDTWVHAKGSVRLVKLPKDYE